MRCMESRFFCVDYHRRQLGACGVDPGLAATSRLGHDISGEPDEGQVLATA